MCRTAERQAAWFEPVWDDGRQVSELAWISQNFRDRRARAAHSKARSAARRNFASFLWPLSLVIAVQPFGGRGGNSLPRERPQLGTQDRPTPNIDLAPSPCQLRLAELAAFKPKPPLLGPGECGATEVVELSARMPLYISSAQKMVTPSAVPSRCSLVSLAWGSPRPAWKSQIQVTIIY